MRHLYLLFISLIFVLVSVCASTTSQAADSLDTLTETDSLILADSMQPRAVEVEIQNGRTIAERLTALLDDPIFKTSQVGIYVYDLTDDYVLFKYNERQCLRPASTMKVVTAVTALRELGGDYKYRTTFYADRALSDSDSIYNGHIYVRGGYDPLLGHDDLQAFADTLKAHGVRHISSFIGLDLSFKDDKRWGWGWCWDDIAVPLTPLLYDNSDNFAKNLRKVLREAGIQWYGTTKEATVPTQAVTLCVRTHTIDQVLQPMMKQSNNSMAESLFYQIAAASGKSGVGRKHAAARINALIHHIGLESSDYQVADGSGLSLYNYLSPELLGKLLRYAYHDEKIYNHLLPSLPIAAVDGTLHKRMHNTKAAENVQAKTGTLTGVSTLAGYCTASNGHRLCFSIMNQGIRKNSTGRDFQDRVCKALCR